MASKVDEEHSSDTQDAVIYIMPQRIQKKMLLDVKNAVNRHCFSIREKFGDDVTHVVTQYSEYDQVVRQLQRDGAAIGEGGGDSPPLTAHVVTLAWLSACLKAGTILPVENRHRLKPKVSKDGDSPSVHQQGREQQPALPAWACQRVTPLKHPNEKFTKALETLETYADFRGGDSDYSRALAFRRASCVLKSLPFRVERLRQVEGLRDLGGHAMRVIRSILEEGYCEEVENVCNDWFSSMKTFTSIFGIGPATAKKWIERGLKTIEDVRKLDDIPRDDRVVWGLAFHEDLIDPVTREEADAFTQLVQHEAESILPGVIVQLTGGFRRGKPVGHDVDILLTHPDEGKEQGLLPNLLHALEKKGLVLMGRLETSSYHPDVLLSDYKLTGRSMLDHFEKWLGICKFDESWRRAKGRRLEGSSAVGERKKMDVDDVGSPSEKKSSAQRDASSYGNKSAKEETESSDKAAGGTAADGDLAKPEVGVSERLKNWAAGEHQERKTSEADKKAADTCTNHPPPEKRPREGNGDQDTNPEKKPKTPGTEDKAQAADVEYRPAMKKHKTVTGLTPSEIAASERSWKARRVDLIVSPWSQYFYALVGWTGNRHFNRDLRLYAQKECNMKLTSHGLYDFTKNESLPANSEAAVFHNLKLEYREPWERNC